jgi:hypothetical protein
VYLESARTAGEGAGLHPRCRNLGSPSAVKPLPPGDLLAAVASAKPGRPVAETARRGREARPEHSNRLSRLCRSLPALEAGRRRTAPLWGKQYASDFCRLLSAFVVGPELERAQVVRYRATSAELGGSASSVCPRLAAPRTVSGSGDVFEAVAVVYRRVPAPFARI